MSKMPEDIQERISHTFDTSIGLAVDNAVQSLTANVTKNANAITTAQITHADRNNQLTREVGELTVAKLDSGFSTLHLRCGDLETKFDGAMNLATNQASTIMEMTTRIDMNLNNTFYALNSVPKIVSSDSDIQAITQDILRDLWRLLACLQKMVHELM